MAVDGKISLIDNTGYKLFQSNILECYIDDDRYEHISYFRKVVKIKQKYQNNLMMR